jgi:hypothetical protein
MKQEQINKGRVERGAAFFEKLHYGIGAAALVGAEIASSSALLAFGAYEVLHGAFWTLVTKWRQNKSSKSPKLARAPV